MGTIDTLTKDYMSDPQHFADACNFYLFGGRQIIQPDTLTELDPAEISIIYDKAENEVTQKFRDVLKQCVLMENELASYIILGIEDQAYIHYAMPIKNMIYDALHYGKQVSQTTLRHKNDKDLSGDEFLSGFARSDCLKPVFTLTIYFGAKDWDAPRSLYEMFEISNPNILKYINDYKLNLIVPNEIKDFSLFSSELKNVLQFIASSNDKNAIRKIIQDSSYQHLHVNTVQLINSCTNMKIPTHQGEQEVNMNKGIREWLEEETKKAVIQASIEAWQDVSLPKEEIISKLKTKYNLTESQAENYYKEFSLQTV